jgi:hypothetical protein
LVAAFANLAIPIIYFHHFLPLMLLPVVPPLIAANSFRHPGPGSAGTAALVTWALVVAGMPVFGIGLLYAPGAALLSLAWFYGRYRLEVVDEEGLDGAADGAALVAQQ